MYSHRFRASGELYGDSETRKLSVSSARPLRACV
jgi:hypothetical protein